jgi:hypothetical protein
MRRFVYSLAKSFGLNLRKPVKLGDRVKRRLGSIVSLDYRLYAV